MKKIFLPVLILLSTLLSASAQVDTSIVVASPPPPPSKLKIAIFTPLYLDSAYVDDTMYRYAKNVFPKFINPGLEFYEGAQLALDSLSKEGVPLEVYVYDTRSADQTPAEQLAKAQADSVGLVIGYCGGNEIKLFADEALKSNIPFINVNYPNDGGVTGNPFFVVLNPTLKTQCEGVYRHLQKYYSLNTIIVFRKKGPLEDRIKTYFDDFGKSTVAIPLKLKYVDLIDSFTMGQLRSNLDSTIQTVCIAGSLDENFGKRLTQQLAILKKQYPVSVIGMPTWDAIKDFSKPEYRGIEITYGTPFYNGKVDKISTGISTYFNTKMYARPSDMVFRGYEVIWKYAKLLLQYNKDIASNLGNKQFKVFTDYDIQPVLNKESMTLDYFENKKLYFVKWQDGIIKAIY